MIRKDELSNFKKMWTWLIAYPAHDREYYMKHVIKLDETWVNRCPLSNNPRIKECNGCQVLWDNHQGNLCTDQSAPVFKWMNTEKNQPDDRSFYASQAAVLAMKAIRKLE